MMSKVEKVGSFRDLLVWQRGLDVVSGAYQLCNLLPDVERYGLASQIRRAAYSVPANIAEGSARNNTGEFVHFIGYALGSLAELETAIVIASRQYDIRTSPELLGQIHETARMLHGLRKSLRSNPRAAIRDRA